ncbi:hypothetical protein PYJP_04200 [Pyrofollis japonicus]|uniref:hypothetical protein n=1 Tax=Pyrofollis japonicus TaxID=3060460 RepID=UPI00295BE555|nr:hypothetical protein [Pyrofollis japonicus]BEP17068.1 hypothetical protein PYJP_04200 [Pyrofollis japonicus]
MSSATFYRVPVRAVWELDVGRKLRADLATIYRYLLCIKEAGGKANLTGLQKCGGGSMTTVSKYVEIMKAKGLIEEEEGGRERVFKLTRKGEDYLFLFARLLALIGEQP